MTTELQALLGETNLEQLSRSRIERLQAEVERLPQFEPPTRHLVHGGMYAREMFMPAGSIVIGRIHKVDHLVHILGDVSIYTVGGSVVRISGCHLCPSTAGAKRALVAHMDTWITTMHAVHDGETDIDELERRFVCDDFLALDEFLALTNRSH